MERKIGEIQQINGKWYQLVKADKNNSCNGCSFFLSDNGKDCIIRCRNYGLIYKKLKIGGVPYSRDGKTYQTYIVPYTPYFYNGEYYVCQTFDSRYFIAEINKEDMKENEENKYDGKMDKECIPLCDALNSLPDVETTESCCGHCKDRFNIFFNCEDTYSLSVIAISFDRRYSGTYLEWRIELITNDNGSYSYFVHSVEKYDNFQIMNEDISQLIKNIKHWSSDEYKNYFSGDVNKIVETRKFKPFDLEAAKAGKPVCTRGGAKARIICFDAKSYTPIIALVTADNGEELAFFYKTDGIFCDGENPDNDIVMLSEKHEGWVNVYNSLGVITFSHNPFDTKEEALATEMEFPHKDYVDTVKIEWEE